jgi:hypothetical protein
VVLSKGSLPLVLGVGLVVSLLVQAPLASGRSEASAEAVTHVTVTLGTPSEYGMTLSANRVPFGVVAFAVTNRGALPHVFKVCARATDSTTPGDCAGMTTPALAPGGAAVLEVVFRKAGSFEYASTVPGHAKAAIGILDVGSNAYGGEKFLLARTVEQCMHSHGLASYPDNGNLTGNRSKPSALRSNATEKHCEAQSRMALGLP